MEMTRACILERNIDDGLWSEVFLAMTNVKNICPISTLSRKSLHKSQFYKAIDVLHFHVLGSTVYVLIYKKEQNIKSKKFEGQV